MHGNIKNKCWWSGASYLKYMCTFGKKEECVYDQLIFKLIIHSDALPHPLTHPPTHPHALAQPHTHTHPLTHPPTLEVQMLNAGC